MGGTDAHLRHIRENRTIYLITEATDTNPETPKPPKTRHTSEVAYAHTKHDPTDRRLAHETMRNDCRCRESECRLHIAYAHIAYAKEQAVRGGCNHASSRRIDWRVLAGACIACMHPHTLHLSSLNGRLVLPLPKGRAKTLHNYGAKKTLHNYGIRASFKNFT